MKPQGTIRIDPPGLESLGPREAIEIVIPYTEWLLGLAAVDRAAVVGARLSTTVRLIAVHTVPYPMPLGCPATAHARLVEQLVDLASRSPLTVQPQVILARSRFEGFRAGMQAESTVLLARRRRLWKTPEDRLAAMLASEGHQVALFYVE
jgi:hypothetical protein